MFGINIFFLLQEKMKTIDISVQEFLQHCKYEKNLSEKTIKAYSADLQQFVVFAYVKMELEIAAINKNVLKDYISSISKYRPKTIKRKIASLKVFFNYLEFEDEISLNPFRKMKIRFREPKVLPSVMSLTEVLSVFKSVYNARYETKAGDHKIDFARDIALIELLFAIGARVSELSTLKLKNIDLEQGIVKLEGKGNKERIIQVCNKEALVALKQYDATIPDAKRKREYFFVNRLNKRLSEQSIRYIVKRHVSSSKIGSRITPHTFRHTFATLLLEEGVDIKYIQQMLGHSSILTTQIYTHVSKEKQKEILSTMHPRKHFSMA